MEMLPAFLALFPHFYLRHQNDSNVRARSFGMEGKLDRIKFDKQKW